MIKPLEKLSQKHLNFCKLIVEGLHKDAECYQLAGYKCNKNTAKDKAWRLKTDNLIKIEIKRLKELAEKDFILTIVECKAKLGTIIKDATSKDTTVIKAIDSLSKLSAWDEQTINLNVNKKVDDLSDQDLLDLIGE